MSPKPVFVLCPGAWHVPAHFDYVTKELNDAGYRSVGVHLPSNSMNPRKENGELAEVQDDVDEVRRVVLQQLDNGNNVAVVTHSYGTVPGTAALYGLSTAARVAEGKDTGVVAVAIIAGLLFSAGATIWDTMGHQFPPVFLRQGDITLPFGKTKTALSSLYHDLSEDEQLKAVHKLVGQSCAVYHNALPDQCAGVRHIPVHYLACKDDQALPFDAQQEVIQGFRAVGVEVQVQVASCAHTPFVKIPKETALFLRRAAGETVQTGLEGETM